jgi:AcrR family transcriptional regulator
MASLQPISDNPVPVIDHRIEVAARKRIKMRARLLDSTLRAFVEASNGPPTIDDVAKLANVSRGTFYLHFRSVDEALQALSQAQSDQMSQGTLAVYDLLKEPWERFSVGFRVFLKRAHKDPLWALFVTRSVAASDELLVTALMKEDLRRGQEVGQFKFNDLRVALDFMMSASVAGIRVLGQGVPEPEPERYMDDCTRMALTGLGCSNAVIERGVRFSREYLEGWKMRLPGDEGPSFD